MFLVNQICEGFKFVANKGLEGLERTANNTLHNEIAPVGVALENVGGVLYGLSGLGLGLFITGFATSPLVFGAALLAGAPTALADDIATWSMMGPALAAVGGIPAALVAGGASVVMEMARNVDVHLPRLAMNGPSR